MVVYFVCLWFLRAICFWWLLWERRPFYIVVGPYCDEGTDPFPRGDWTRNLLHEVWICLIHQHTPTWESQPIDRWHFSRDTCLNNGVCDHWSSSTPLIWRVFSMTCPCALLCSIFNGQGFGRLVIRGDQHQWFSSCPVHLGNPFTKKHNSKYTTNLIEQSLSRCG